MRSSRGGFTGRQAGFRLVVLNTVLLATAIIGMSADRAAAEKAPVQVSATEARLSGDKAATKFELIMSSGLTAEVFTLANPYRVVVDLPDLNFQLKEGTGQKGLGLVSVFRYGLFAERKSRIVIDTKGPVKIASATMSRTPDHRINFAIVMKPTDAKSFGLGTGAARTANPAPVADPHATAKQPVSKDKPVIVIDPGHGGIDPGAIGSNLAEKTIVLAVAKALEAALIKTGAYDVKMTRTDDVFVSLDRRLEFSYENGADLFISLHADSIKSSADTIRGATVYTLSERASDRQAQEMAEKENASDLLAGLQTADGKEDDEVKSILIDLLRRETSNFSADFSRVVAARLGKTIAMSRVPRRSAAFKVLKQANAPSVLIELGYMSNAKDQKEMTSPSWQAKVAASMVSAVNSFFGTRKAQHP